MDIEKVLRKIVENLEYAVNDEDGEIIESGVNALIHALLNSEEVVVVPKKKMEKMQKALEAAVGGLQEVKRQIPSNPRAI